MFCKHDWTVLSDKVTKSGFEIMAETHEVKINANTSTCILDRKSITIVACKKCGAIKKFVTEV